MPISIERLGSSTLITGSGRGSSGSVSVSPMCTSSMPAMAMISPGPASSTATRVSSSVTVRSVILTRSVVPSTRQRITVSPRLSTPLRTRQSASRPRYGEASRFVTSACSGWPSSYEGGGTVVKSISNSGSRSSPGCSGSSVACPARALQ